MIGDSMIYGSGLPYGMTFGPVLEELGLPACVFGVTGNSPNDYLATLRFVADRLEPDARVVFYIYAYNDFVTLDKYLSRGFLSLSNRFCKPFEWSQYFDQWRQGTVTRAAFRRDRTPPPMKQWGYDFGKAEPIRLLYAHDPAEYRQPKSLNRRHRLAYQSFLEQIGEEARVRGWQVSVLIHPDNAEIYANFARRSNDFEDLDPRRAEAVKMCESYPFDCGDISRYIYVRSIAAGRNPYFVDDRHFSQFGTRIVAEHLVAHVRQAAAKQTSLEPKKGARVPLSSPVVETRLPDESKVD